MKVWYTYSRVRVRLWRQQDNPHIFECPNGLHNNKTPSIVHSIIQQVHQEALKKEDISINFTSVAVKNTMEPQAKIGFDNFIVGFLKWRGRHTDLGRDWAPIWDDGKGIGNTLGYHVWAHVEGKKWGQALQDKPREPRRTDSYCREAMLVPTASKWSTGLPASVSVTFSSWRR